MSHSWAGIKQRSHQQVQGASPAFLTLAFCAFGTAVGVKPHWPCQLIALLLVRMSPLQHTWYWASCWKNVDSPPAVTSATTVGGYIQELKTIQAGTHICTIHPSLDGHRQYFSCFFVTEMNYRSVTDLKFCSHLPVHGNMSAESPGALRKVSQPGGIWAWSACPNCWWPAIPDQVRQGPDWCLLKSNRKKTNKTFMGFSGIFN